MKPIRLLLGVAALLACCYASAQSLQLRKDKISVKEAMDLITQTTGYSFIYASSDIDMTAVVKLHADNLEQAVSQTLGGQQLSFKISGKNILVKKDDSTPAAPKSVTGELEGVVIDETGLPIPGATVHIKGSTKGVMTDLDGRFTISVQRGEQLMVSFLGYEEASFEYSGQKHESITLVPKRNELDEAVLVAYGKQRKESVIGAISTINVDKLSHSTNKLSNVLAGQMAGIVSVQRSGEPGEGSDFWIRGVSTFGANNRPLVLVDGIERDLNLVDADDVETFSILKDATATALYGVRGANGVVLISTRRGKEIGKPVISGRVETTISAPTRMPQMASAEEFMSMYNYAYADANDGRLFYSEEAMAKYLDGSDPDLYPNVNWMDTIYKNMADSYRANVNVTGGNERIKYYVAGSFYRENGIFKPDSGLGYNPSNNWSRFNFRSNVDIQLFEHTTLNVNLSNQYDIKRQPNNNYDLWIYALKMIPIAIPTRYSDGTVARPTIGENPYNLLNLNGYNEIFTNNAQSLVGLTQDFAPLLEGLKGNVKFSWDAFNYAHLNRSKNPSTYYAVGRNEDGSLKYVKNNDGSDYLSLYRSNAGTRTFYLESSLTYDQVFAEKHRVGTLLLFNLKDKADNFPASYIASLPYRNLGIAGRATYSYADRYFIEGNFGYNGSENFSPQKRFGFFPSVAAGYMISNEPFWKELRDVVSLLKIKGSYGLIGNDQIGGNRRFAFNSEMQYARGYIFGDKGGNELAGLATGYPGSPDVSWELAKKFNAGIELELFYCFKLDLDIFHEHRSGIFIERASVPSVVGINVNPYLNLGEMENKGIDASLEFNKRINSELSISARGNFTFNRNKKLYDDQPHPNYPYMDVIGKPWNQQFGYIALGYFLSEDEIANSPKQLDNPRVGDLKYKDINGDGIVNTDDYVAIGRTSIPEINYGFGVNLNWRNFDISFFFQGVGNVTAFIRGETLDMSDTNQLYSNVYRDVALNYWTPERPDAKYPRLSINGSQNNLAPSTHNQRDMSFLRLKSAEIGYALPKQVCKKLSSSGIRFYISGSNLLTFSKFDLWDPEINSSQGASYPNMRAVNLGATFNF